jgi:uncharacterized protein (TIGR00369 family)
MESGTEAPDTERGGVGCTDSERTDSERPDSERPDSERLRAERAQRRRAWFRNHWQNEVAFNQLCGLRITRWEPDGVEAVLPFADQLTAHEGILHGGVIAALIDTIGTGVVIAGHDYDTGSRTMTVSLTVNYLSTAPRQDLVAVARTTKRGRLVNFADVEVHGADTGKLVAHGVVTVVVQGDRPGVPD